MTQKTLTIERSVRIARHKIVRTVTQLNFREKPFTHLEKRLEKKDNKMHPVLFSELQVYRRLEYFLSTFL